MKWVTLSVLAALSLAVHTLTMTKLSRNGYDVGKINFNVFFIVLVFLTLQQLISGKGYRLPSTQYPYLLIAALGAYLIIQLSLKALTTAPNPGYVNGLISLSTALVAVSSVFLFNAQLGLSKIVGIILCLVGVYLIGK